jgi:hypothetical protein
MEDVKEGGMNNVRIGQLPEWPATPMLGKVIQVCFTSFKHAI